MTQLERNYLNHAIEHSRPVSATAASYDPEKGYVGQHDEAARLLDSEDYRKGWQACHERFTLFTEALLAGDKQTMKRAINRR